MRTFCLLFVFFVLAERAHSAQLLETPPTRYKSGGGSNGVATGDFDKDGRLDFVVVAQNSNTAEVFLNDGTGQFGVGETRPAWGTSLTTTDVAVGDVNGDTWPDFVVSTFQGSQVHVFLNSGVGSLFGTTVLNLTIPICGSYTVALGDFDGDTHLDIVVASCNGVDNRLVFFRNSGNTPTPSFVTSEMNTSLLERLAVADFDLDGDLDIVASAGNGVFVFRNNGTGTFAETFLAGNTTGKLAAADLNGDSYPDILAVSKWDGTMIWLSTGSGSFQAPVFIPYIVSPNISPYFVGAPCDFNNDGFKDFVAVGPSYGNGYATVFLNDGTGAAFSPTLFLIAEYPYVAACGDFTGDSKPELVVVAAYAPSFPCEPPNQDGSTFVYTNIAFPAVQACATPGLPCNDNNLCTFDDTCQSDHTCSGTLLDCSSLPSIDSCHVKGTCNPSTGRCSSPIAPVCTLCDDSNMCTSGDYCDRRGRCVGMPQTGILCSNSSAVMSCILGSSCVNGACVGGSFAAPGSACNDFDPCNGNTDTCDSAGSCSSPPLTCSSCLPPLKCHCGECVCPSAQWAEYEFRFSGITDGDYTATGLIRYCVNPGGQQCALNGEISVLYKGTLVSGMPVPLTVNPGCKAGKSYNNVIYDPPSSAIWGDPPVFTDGKGLQFNAGSYPNVRIYSAAPIISGQANYFIELVVSGSSKKRDNTVTILATGIGAPSVSLIVPTE